MKLPFGKSTLRKAVERGLKNGNIQDEIKDLGDLTIKSRGDAEDICWGLKERPIFPPVFISRIERGVESPSLDNLVKIARALDVRVQVLVAGI